MREIKVQVREERKQSRLDPAVLKADVAAAKRQFEKVGSELEQACFWLGLSLDYFVST